MKTFLWGSLKTTVALCVLSALFFYAHTFAGDSSGSFTMVNDSQVLANVEWYYTCNGADEFHFTVSAASGYAISGKTEERIEIWVKEGTTVHLTAQSSTFGWLGYDERKDLAAGYLGSFQISQSNHSLEFQCITRTDAGGQPKITTASPTLELQCPIEIKLQNFDAYPCTEGVKIEWDVASEINLAGYNIYRGSAENKDFIKINPALIVAESRNGQYEYVDTGAPSGQNYYKLEDVSLDGFGTFHGPVLAAVATNVKTGRENVTDYALAQNYPNPFNPTTTISYTLPAAQFVTLEIYDLRGIKVRTLVDALQVAGSHNIVWDATDQAGDMVCSGVYIYRMRAGAFHQTARMLLLK